MIGILEKNRVSVVTYNTFIGGISSVTNTAALLSAKIGVPVGNISNFTVVGSDIKCKITGSYTPTALCWNANTSITYYRDTDGLVLQMPTFFGCTSMSGKVEFINATSVDMSGGGYLTANTGITKVILPKVTSLGNYAFNNSSYTKNLKTVYIPLCTSLGSTSAFNNVFESNNTLLKIYANTTLQTNNGGSPDGDLTGWTVSYVANYTVPNSVTTLAAGMTNNTSIQLNLTAPSSTNAIDYYEVLIDGVYSVDLKNAADYIYRLDKNTTYNITVVAIDIYYNKSVISNSISQLTSNYSYNTETTAFISASGISNEYQKDALHILSSSLISNSIYSKLKVLNVKVGGTAAMHKWNFIDPRDLDAAYRYVYGGTWTHSALGAVSNGTNAYANTYLNLITLGLTGNFSFGYYLTVANTSFGDRHSMGAYTSGSNWVGNQHNSSTQLYGMAYGSGGLSLTIASPNNGFFATSVNSTTKKVYHKGLSATGTTNGTAPANINFYEGALNVNNGYYSGLSATYGTSFIATGLTDTEIGNLQTAIIAFETALGRNV